VITGKLLGKVGTGRTSQRAAKGTGRGLPGKGFTERESLGGGSDARAERSPTQCKGVGKGGRSEVCEGVSKHGVVKARRIPSGRKLKLLLSGGIAWVSLEGLPVQGILISPDSK